ncbi:MAG TPA: glycosyltransferase, partial [Cryptosporangiaceae bacterium]|nr:glycosyltransferase [Cryptosporangiaceae bacterium]
TTAGAGHFGPLLPFARALEHAGHDVVVAAPTSFAAAVERAGFVHRPFPDAPAEAMGAVFAGLHGLSNEEGNEVVVRDVFGRLDAQAALPGIRALVDEWRPDLVVRESSEFASWVVAVTAGVPCVEVAVGLAAFDERFLPLLEAPLAEMGAEGGVSRLRSAPRLSLVPELLEDPSATGSPRTRRFRDAERSTTADALPDWWAGASGPLVYVTFGSVAGGLGLFPGFYRQVVAAISDLPVRILVTIGDAGDPDVLQPLTGNVHVENWWPQQEVMPHADALIGHGGFGTTLTALASGVPMVVLPLFADQPHNAARVAALGAGIALDGGHAAIGRLNRALQRVLDEQSFRDNARRVADEVDRLPPASESVRFLEGLTG